MPFATGSRVGPYEIVAPIGAGGMGEVWKARDTRLDRIVAIKTSHAKFSERFEREARSIAALNHPNICQLYDVGPDYLVMEYVEGTPVAPVDTSRKLLDIAVQLSDGLAAAHSAGIIHRDLKPDNILITRDGRIKILDFGLAKATDSGAAPSDAASSDATRTIAMAVTEAGTTLGTIAYMSPEQARGNVNLTAQSDQFSMGLVLYELAAGRRAFQRASAAETMTGIIREEAEPLPSAVLPQLRWIIDRLLSKEPADRYDSTRDLYRELRQVRDRLSEATVSGAVPAISVPEQPRRRARGRVLAASLALALLASAVTWFIHPAVGSGQQIVPIEVSWEEPSGFVWSPDGKAFAYGAGARTERRVFLRYLNSPAATPLTRGDESRIPLGWSPDGKRVIISGKNPQGDRPPHAILAVPVFGGEPELVMPVPEERGEAISADGRSLATIRTEEDGTLAIYTASPVGSPLKLYSPAPFKTGTYLNDPKIRFSPDGKSVLLLLDVPGGRQAWQLPYPSGGKMPRRVLNGLPSDGGTPVFSWFPDGRHGVLGLDDEQGQSHLWSVGLYSGSRRQLTSGASSESSPAVSPDGKKILFTQPHAEFMIVSASLTDATVARVISSGLANGMPAWAPHQEKLVYVSARNGPPAIWMRSEGWDRPIVTMVAFPPGTTNWFMTPTLSPGADRVIFTRVAKDQRVEDWISSASGGTPVRLTNAKDAVEVGGSWSPDASRFVYGQIRNRTISLMMVRTTGEAEPATFRANVGGGLPEWSPDGQWIKFRDRDEQGGWSIISPDGKTVRTFGEPKTVEMTFSGDSRRLYGIRIDGNHRYLFSVDIATKEEKTIGDVGKEFTPDSNLNPGIRLSLSPDGKSVTYPAIRRSSSLWMLEGFDQPTWSEQLRERLPW